jgi:hypothetical protein
MNGSARRALDEHVAREVAAAFTDARHDPRRAIVREAYRQLERQTDAMWHALTSAAVHGYRVRFTTDRVPYASDRELIDAVRAERLLEVTTAAIERDRPHPILDCSAGGAYDRFRAVHDLIGHVRHDLGFDRDGEHAAWIAQDRLHRGLARWALATELHAEHSVRWTTGEVAEHKAVLLDPRLVARARVGRGYRRLGSVPPRDRPTASQQ